MITYAARTALAVAFVSLVFAIGLPAHGQPPGPGASLVGFNGECLNSAESVPFIPGPSVYLSECADVVLRYSPPTVGASQPIRVSNGSCLASDTVSSTIGVLLSEQPCDGSPHQRWTATPDGEIVNVGSSLCLAPIGPDPSTGSTIGTELCDGGLTQRWQIRSHGRFRTLGLGDGAEVTAVATSPEDGHLWLGTNGGVFRTTDDGESFFGARFRLPATQVQQLAVAPDDSQTAWAQTTQGLYRTVDGGRTWQALRTDTARFGMHPTSQRLWVFTSDANFDPNGMLRSDDRGKTWIPVTNPQTPELYGYEITDLAFTAADPDRLWVSTARGGLDVTRWDQGIWTTADGGQSWVQAYADRSVHEVVADDADPATAYASVFDRGLVETRDGGATWTAIDDPNGIPASLRGPLALDGSTLYAAARDGALWAFDTVERTWTNVAEARTPLAEIWAIHVDPRTAGRLYVEGQLDATNRSGLLRSDDGGDTWALHDKGLRVAFIDRVTAPSARSRELYVSAESQVFRSIDGGLTWSYATGFAPTSTNLPPIPIVARPGAAPVSGSTSPTTIWAGRSFKGSNYAKHQLRRSTDGGITWEDENVSTSDEDIRDLTLAPDDRTRLYAAGTEIYSNGGGIYRSTGDGQSFSWTSIGPDAAFAQIEVLADGWLFARSVDALYRSTDDGATWTQISEDGRLISATRWNDEVVLARGAGNQGIELSTDGGTTWSAQTVPPCAIGAEPTLHPTKPDVIYLASGSTSADGPCVGARVWVSHDGGDRWTSIGGLSTFGVRELQILPGVGTDRLLVATTGGGAAEAWIDGPLPVALHRDRFSVSVAWQDSENQRGVAEPVDLTLDSGLFWFFDSENLEMLIKVLDGRAFNGHFWVLWGAATDVGLDITITDHATGEVWTGSNPVGTFASGGDVEAFADPDVQVVDNGIVGPALNGYRVTGPDLPLGENGRFVARVSFEDSTGRNTGEGIEIAEDTGAFYFFDGSNVELLVKVLDGRPINGHFWAYWASTSNLTFDLCIEDTETGVERCWQNADGTFASGADTEAFDG